MEWCLLIYLPVCFIVTLITFCNCEKVAACLVEGEDIETAKRIADQQHFHIVTQVEGLERCFLFERDSYRSKRGVPGSRAQVEVNFNSYLAVKAAEVSISKIRVKKSEHIFDISNSSKYLRNRKYPSNFPNISSNNILDNQRHYNQNRRKKRYNKSFIHTFKDPFFHKQWHLHNTEYIGRDLNVLPVWSKNITGDGVTVAILDDGVEHTHPDIKDNYNADLSWDLLDNDGDPSPVSTSSDKNDHGTRCAGQVAASTNLYCGVGVAYNAKIAAIRMLKYKVEDMVEAKALQFRRDKIDIYSSSWGPIDDGKKVDGPGLLVRTAFEEGVKYGRDGKGSIYVWASGNGGINRDNCNCDGYCSSIYTISISAVNEKGEVPHYVEDCSATLAAAYSSGTNNDRRIYTTDLNSSCNEVHGGTSAAAPLAAGVIALALSANPTLTWRDVQHIVVQTSKHIDNAACSINGAGRCVNNKIGYGILNTAAMVEAASTWQNVGAQHVCKIVNPPQDLAIKDTQIKNGNKLIVQIDTNACIGQSTAVSVLEHVQAILSISHDVRGELKIDLTSPAGTKSALLTERPSDKNSQGFTRWSFLTVHMWGEDAAGRWTLTISSSGTGSGELTYFELLFYGTKYNHNSSGALKCNQLRQISPRGEMTCVQSCQRFGYYQTGSTCRACNVECLTCSDYNTCTSCPDHLFLLYEKNRCVSECPEDYTINDSVISGQLCDKIVTTPWYKGDMVYIAAVVVFIMLLILVVLLISVHHYRKYRSGATPRARTSSSCIPHRPLPPVTATPVVVLPSQHSGTSGDRAPTHRTLHRSAYPSPDSGISVPCVDIT